MTSYQDAHQHSAGAYQTTFTVVPGAEGDGGGGDALISQEQAKLEVDAITARFRHDGGDLSPEEVIDLMEQETLLGQNQEWNNSEVR